MFAAARYIAPVARSALVSNSKLYLRPLSSAVISQTNPLVPQRQSPLAAPVSLLPIVRSLQTSAVTRDIDSAAKFIGAGAATVLELEQFSDHSSSVMQGIHLLNNSFSRTPS